MTITLLDIAKANGSDMVTGLIDETTKATPELTLVPARTIKGISYKTLVRTALPSVAFRDANQGQAATKASHENRVVETYILNPRWQADKAVADRYEDGAAAYIALEAQAHVEASMQLLSKQFYYGRGTGGDGKGYPGLLQAYDATNMAVDATGTSAGTGSSVWAVALGPQKVTWVWGNNGLIEPSEVDERDAVDANSLRYTAYHQELLAYPGLQVSTIRAIARIKKLTEENGKGLTDILLGRMLEKFETGIKPDVIFMNRRSLRQLRESRTTYSPTGMPAPTPTEYEGIPIAVTDGILNTEDLAL
jgi:hypothetical protein